MTTRRASPALLALALALPAGPASAANLQDLLPGSRAQAMGGAYTAVGDDVSALFYNPASQAAKPLMDADGELSRIVAPSGPLTSVLLGYARPVPVLPGGTASAAYYGLRQPGIGDKDTFAFGWAMNQPVAGLTRPLKWGTTVKVIDYRTPDHERLGLGADGGVLVEAKDGTRLGASVLDLVTDVGLPTPTLSMGAARAFGRWTVAGDLRMRSGLTAFYPGIEGSFYSGLLKLRAGKGLPWDGRSSLALGLGIDLSPLVIDLQMNLPWRGTNEPVSNAGFTIGWRFGAPLFYNRLVGTSSDEAARLSAEVDRLRAEKARLDQEAETARVNKGVLDTELSDVQAKLEAAKGELKAIPPVVSSAAEPPKVPAKAAAPKRKAEVPPSWPQRHVVAEGDTLRSIAGQYYGDPSLWELIYNANTDKIERGLPKVGAELSVPEPRH